MNRYYGDIRDVLTTLPHRSDIYGAEKWLVDPNRTSVRQACSEALGCLAYSR